MVDHYIFITIFICLIGMVVGIIGVVVNSSIIFSIGLVLVASAVIGLFYMGMLK